VNYLYLLAIFICNYSFSQNALYIPPAITSTTINLNLQEGVTQFYPGINTTTLGANGPLLGPTLIMNQGDNVNISVDNQLTDTTTIHWHGMHVSPENDGGPHSIILPGEIWNPQFEVMDRAGINWYHPHLHSRTNKHVSQGIAGMILVKDAEEAALTLPRTYGTDDFPIIIQTKGFDAAGQIEWMSHLDTSLMVNGTIDPFLDAPAQVVRIRVLNGSSQRAFKLGLTNNMQFELIGTDGSLLSAPVSLTRYQVAPGQRADILINLTGMQGQTIQLMNYGTEIGNAIYGSSQPGMMPQLTLPDYNVNPLNGNDFAILDVNVVGQTALPVITIPTSLVVHNVLTEGTEDETRSLLFTTQQNIVGPFLINNAAFDMSTINYTIPLGNREIWSLTNQTPIAHPFHIHDVQFYILDINGSPPPAELQGLHDVVMVPAGMGNVRFITEFLDFANDTIPYMYHCHMLPHEDAGMMGQFIVQDPSSNLDETVINELVIVPNPSLSGETTIEIENYNGSIQIMDLNGRILIEESVSPNSVLHLQLQSGTYLLKDKFGSSKKFIII
jgi:bilirubin oxidase